MYINILDLIKYIFFGSIAIFTPFILVKLYQLLNKLDKVVANAEHISDQLKETLKDQSAINSFVKELASNTAIDVVEHESAKFGRSLAQRVLKLIIRGGVNNAK